LLEQNAYKSFANALVGNTDPPPKRHKRILKSPNVTGPISIEDAIALSILDRIKVENKKLDKRIN